MRLRIRAAVAVMVLLGLVGWAPGRPATARTDELQVSLNGQRWFSRIDQPLFDTDRRWVPGDTQTVTVWARNTSTEAAGLSIGIVADPGSRLDEELLLTATANGQPLRRALDNPVVPGDLVRVDITLAFPVGAGNVSQRQRLDLTLRLTLTQRVPSQPPTNEPLPPPASEPGLPSTGLSTASSVLLVVGSLLLSTGATVLAARRRSRPSRGER